MRGKTRSKWWSCSDGVVWRPRPSSRRPDSGARGRQARVPREHAGSSTRCPLDGCRCPIRRRCESARTVSRRSILASRAAPCAIWGSSPDLRGFGSATGRGISSERVVGCTGGFSGFQARRRGWSGVRVASSSSILHAARSGRRPFSDSSTTSSSSLPWCGHRRGASGSRSTSQPEPPSDTGLRLAPASWAFRALVASWHRGSAASAGPVGAHWRCFGGPICLSSSR